jgi:hypothetical protein
VEMVCSLAGAFHGATSRQADHPADAPSYRPPSSAIVPDLKGHSIPGAG